MVRPVVNAALALALLPACVAQPETGRDRAPITNGADDDGDPAVVALMQAGLLLCSGTLIAPRVVLTAGHCIDGVDQVVFGAIPAAPSATRGVLVARAHPDFDASSLSHDIGLVLLDGAAPVTAAPLAIGEPVEAAALRLVGYGRTDPLDQSAARKREGTSVIDTLEASTFRILPAPSQACEGDSGGPAFYDPGDGEVVVGVTSQGDAACDEFTVYARAAFYQAAFIAPFVAETADASAAIGARCFDDATCLEGTCLFPADAPDVGYCSRACATIADCPDPMLCEAQSCVYPPPSPGAPGAGCAVSTDCTTEVCARPSAGEAVCAERCVPGIFECDDGFECALDVDTDGSSACFPDSDAGGCCSASGPPPESAWLALVVLLAIRRRNDETPRG